MTVTPAGLTSLFLAVVDRVAAVPAALAVDLLPHPGAIGPTLVLLAVGVLLEGPVVAIVAGALAGAGLLDWWMVWPVVVLADVVSDTVFYAIGRAGRRPRVAPLLIRLGLTEQRREQLSDKVTDNLAKVVVGAKLVDVGAIPAFLAIGLAGVSYRRLLSWVVPVSVIRCAVLVGIGWVVGDRLAQELAEHPWIVAGIGAGVGVVLVLGRALWVRAAARRQAVSSARRSG